MTRISSAVNAILPAREDADPPQDARSGQGRVYLRRYSVQAPRRRHRALLLALVLLATLLFSKVWECTVANSLSMERDRLRREVRGLENRIRLSSELTDQAALKEGIDSQALRSQGFVAPEPARIIEIDLNQTLPRALARSGVVARLETWIKGLRGAPARPPDADVEAVPVKAAVGR